jgi:glutamate synthase domain-containing protein 1/glutamate synthase domain-containing protein 3
MNKLMISKLIESRRAIVPEGGFIFPKGEAAEGGCGVIGMASNVQVEAKHMLESLKQMRNRGNGKGGGIAAVGLIAEEFGVSQQVLENDYLLAVAYLDISVREELEKAYIEPVFNIDHTLVQPHIPDHTVLDGLDVPPPEVVIYFVRVRPEVMADFITENGLEELSTRKVEDEIVFQNTYKLNTTYYESAGETRAFVLSHGKNMLVLKMVGYGDDVIEYYKLEETHAHVWIGHHRYPTKGRVWHPGGAHPFIGMNEALVHNGDFANHASISEYLSQRNIYPLFLTDTEVAVQVFDLLHRIYDYPLEYVIEAMAPTTERDFKQLPAAKQDIYKQLQVSHMHSSPDGPWFFLIAQSDTHKEGGPAYSLTGITDTSMLRPQVFAWQENVLENGEKVAIGLAASEKQGIDAAMLSLSESDDRFWSRADLYWNARGGSHTDGGAFIFEVKDKPDDSMPSLEVYDKFGKSVPVPVGTKPYAGHSNGPVDEISLPEVLNGDLYGWLKAEIRGWTYSQVNGFLDSLIEEKSAAGEWQELIDQLTLMMDRRYDTGSLRRSSVLALVDAAFERMIEKLSNADAAGYTFIRAGDDLPEAGSSDDVAIIEARGYQPEGERSVAYAIQRLYANGFRRLMVVHARGHRFFGVGLGTDTRDLRIDAYGSPGDYLASGIDGMEIHVHNNAQDQLAQIMKAGKLVVHGDVGQTFMYGAKGGEAYILGNAAGRPLINAVGKPRVVINGTCLDYLAESFMAGDPLDGGGFVILNGITFDETNAIVELETPYPGGNLFSLASGGAIYVRDPKNVVTDEQLNGSEFSEFTEADWALIKPYLDENERMFDVPVSRMLSVDGVEKSPGDVYRKIQPSTVRALQAEESWVTEDSVTH